MSNKERLLPCPFCYPAKDVPEGTWLSTAVLAMAETISRYTHPLPELNLLCGELTSDPPLGVVLTSTIPRPPPLQGYLEQLIISL